MRKSEGPCGADYYWGHLSWTSTATMMTTGDGSSIGEPTPVVIDAAYMNIFMKPLILIHSLGPSRSVMSALTISKRSFTSSGA